MPGTTVLVKRCIKCGADVTGQQRMKNAKGEYWCMNCGAKEESASTTPANLISPCPRCKQPVHAAQLVRKDGQYVCEACASGAKAPGDKGKTKLIVAGIVLLLSAAIYVLVNFVFA